MSVSSFLELVSMLCYLTKGTLQTELKLWTSIKNYIEILYTPAKTAHKRNEEQILLRMGEMDS